MLMRAKVQAKNVIKRCFMRIKTILGTTVCKGADNNQNLTELIKLRLSTRIKIRP